MSGVLVRYAVASDAAEIANVLRASKAAAMPGLAVPHSLEEDLCWVSEVLLREATVIVAEVDGGSPAPAMRNESPTCSTPGFPNPLRFGPCPDRLRAWAGRCGTASGR